MRTTLSRLTLAICLPLIVSGCATGSVSDLVSEPAKPLPLTHTGFKLERMPSAAKKIVVSVYDIKDETGQHKPNDSFSEYSRAVTQAGDAILIDVLKKAGHGSWFRVMERSNLKNLLQERNIVDVNNELRMKRRLQYALGRDGGGDNRSDVAEARQRRSSINAQLARVQGELAATQQQIQAMQGAPGGQPPQSAPPIMQKFHQLRTEAQRLQQELAEAQKDLDKASSSSNGTLSRAQQDVALLKAAQDLARERAPKMAPLRTSEYIIEGAITGYDANEITGGIGARYLGIGGDKQYRRDIATVTLRLVRVKTGEICLSVTATKTVYSKALRGNAFKFVAIDKILEAEAGVSRNEPPSLAVRHAFELAVFSLIAEGAKQKLWNFKAHDDGRRILDHYDGRYIQPRNNPAIIARPDDLAEFQTGSIR